MPQPVVADVQFVTIGEIGRWLERLLVHSETSGYRVVLPARAKCEPRVQRWEQFPHKSGCGKSTRSD